MGTGQITSPRVSMLEWAVAGSAHPGETTSGDHYLVQDFPGGMLVAVVDGLGHGEEAEHAAQTAVELARQGAELSVPEILQRCHAGLHGTRGVVMTVASLDEASGTMRWTGVGNVEGVVLRPGPRGPVRVDAVLLRGGVVGYQMPPLGVGVFALAPGDALLMATDGLRDDFARHYQAHQSPQLAAEQILAKAATGRDDALVLVARYLGRQEAP
jgi:serine/threonine protein phosphatase PrpC